MRRFIIVCIFCLVLAGIASKVHAHEYSEAVLGEATEASELTFPQVSSGPGLITPDSPFYFLDKAYQNFRLSLTNPQEKVKLRTKIAGERLAELRLMMAKNNSRGIDTALSELTSEMDKAAENLNLAKGQGTNVEKTAIDVNQDLKAQRAALTALIRQARGDLRLRLLAANEALKKSKVEVEDSLPEDQLLKEVEEDLESSIEHESQSATESARKLENAMMRLDELASQAAQKNQTRREEALRHAQEVKSEALLKQQQRSEELRKKKQQALEELRELKLQKAKQTRQEIEKSISEIQNLEYQEKATLEELSADEKALESTLQN